MSPKEAIFVLQMLFSCFPMFHKFTRASCYCLRDETVKLFMVHTFCNLLLQQQQQQKN